MSNHRRLFDSKYPIIEAVMNQGSSLDLAIAVHNAGGFPSLFLNRMDLDSTVAMLEQFRSITGSTNVIVPVTRLMLQTPEILNIIRDFKVSHCEIFTSNAQGNTNDLETWLDRPETAKQLEKLKQTSKLLFRAYDVLDITRYCWFDAVCIKGQESGGKTGSLSVRELFRLQQERYPESQLIPMGGIGTPSQVKWFLDHGAIAVGVGTLFAACLESPISDQVKQKIVNMTSADITQLPDTKQNCLAFEQDPPKDQFGWNRQESLVTGIYGDGSKGHLYLGTAIDHIHTVRSAHDTIQYLCSDLNNV